MFHLANPNSLLPGIQSFRLMMYSSALEQEKSMASSPINVSLGFPSLTHHALQMPRFAWNLAVGQSNQLRKQEGKKSFQSHDSKTCHVTFCLRCNHAARASPTNHNALDSDGYRIFTLEVSRPIIYDASCYD